MAFIWNLAFQMKHCQFQVQNLVFVKPVNAVYIKEGFNCFISWMGFGKTHPCFRITSVSLFSLSPWCYCSPHNHYTAYCCWKWHVWLADCQQMCQNWRWHPSLYLAIYSPLGRHHTCEVWWIISQHSIEWHILQMSGPVVHRHQDVSTLHSFAGIHYPSKLCKNGCSQPVLFSQTRNTVCFTFLKLCGFSSFPNVVTMVNI